MRKKHCYFFALFRFSLIDIRILITLKKSLLCIKRVFFAITS